MLTRRQLLATGLQGLPLVALGSSVPNFLASTAHAAERSSADRVLVVVQLSGGNDGLNTVVPYSDDLYAANRIALRIATDAVHKIDDNLGFHPRMKGFAELLKAGHLSVVQGVGYDHPDRSHFRSMDIWHMAQQDDAHARLGWLGRCLDCTPSLTGSDVPGLHIGGGQLPLALESRETVVASVETVDGFRLRTEGGAVPLSALRSLAEAERAPSASPMLDFLRRSTLAAYVSSEQVRQALEGESSAVRYPENFNLARKLQNVAKLIDAGLSTRIYYVSLDGFDTHANQLQTHAELLGEWSESVSAFVRDLQARGHADRVLVLSFSEFGRRVKENASEGTDHGAAAPVFLAGGRVQGGVLGKQPSLKDLDHDGDLRHHTDFRRLYATILDGWLGCPHERVLSQRFEPLPLLRG